MKGRYFLIIPLIIWALWYLWSYYPNTLLVLGSIHIIISLSCIFHIYASVYPNRAIESDILVKIASKNTLESDIEHIRREDDIDVEIDILKGVIHHPNIFYKTGFLILMIIKLPYTVLMMLFKFLDNHLTIKLN